MSDGGEIATLREYRELMNEHPRKFSAAEVSYRQSDADSQCRLCLHFFKRQIDGFNVCEIFRPDKDASVNPRYVCDFFTTDGDEFPLL